jgi:hypothetical protein
MDEPVLVTTGYWTRSELLRFLASNKITDFKLPTKKANLIIAFPADRWSEGFKQIRVSIHERLSTYGARLYRAEYLN